MQALIPNSALQFSAKFNPMFSTTLQVITKNNGKGNWQPEAEWLYGKAQFSPAWSMRVGRMGLPAFAVSDFRDVNYANTWVRPPLDVYGQVPASNFEGLDLTWRAAGLGANWTTQVFAGRSRPTYRQVKIELDALMGVNVAAEYDNGLTLRAGHLQGDITVKTQALDPLMTGLRAAEPLAPGSALIAAQLSPVNKKASFSGIGLNFDQDSFVMSAEYTKRRTATYIPDTTGWHATLGWRVGAFTPYAVVSQLKTDSTNVNNTLMGTQDPRLIPLRDGVIGALAQQRQDQKTTGLGVRWDAYRNVALKAQVERIRTQQSGGLFYPTTPVFAGARVYSLSVDFVF